MCSTSPCDIDIDIRPEADFEAGHVEGSLNFPADALILRSGELPPRTRQIRLIHNGDESAVATAEAFFARAKWDIVDRVAISILIATNDSPLRKGKGARGLRFWEPSPFVAAMMAQHVTSTVGVAYDYGCGSGRDMAYLAGIGWTCVGIDNRFKLLDQARAMSERYGTRRAGSVDGAQAHLVANSPFRPRSADLVLMVRFLHRPSAPAMLATIAVGGYFLCSHFVDGVQHSAVGTPKSPDAFLRHDELLEWFAAGEGAFEVLHNEETVIEDGRPVVNMLARRVR